MIYFTILRYKLRSGSMRLCCQKMLKNTIFAAYLVLVHCAVKLARRYSQGCIGGRGPLLYNFFIYILRQCTSSYFAPLFSHFYECLCSDSECDVINRGVGTPGPGTVGMLWYCGTVGGSVNKELANQQNLFALHTGTSVQQVPYRVRTSLPSDAGSVLFYTAPDIAVFIFVDISGFGSRPSSDSDPGTGKLSFLKGGLILSFFDQFVSKIVVCVFLPMP